MVMGDDNDDDDDNDSEDNEHKQKQSKYSQLYTSILNSNREYFFNVY